MKVQYLFVLLVTYVSAYAVEEMVVGEDNSVTSDAAEVTDETGTEIAERDNSGEADQSDIGHWFGSSKIAFSAYLSRTKNLGRGQHIKFDRLLMNDGDGYEASTGVFRAKVAGVYMFTYVIAQRHQREIRARLVYDGKVVNGAIAEGMHKYHDSQGTNTAIFHVCKGKAVWVEALGPANLEGNSGDYRYTTFSGFLLYARN